MQIPVKPWVAGGLAGLLTGLLFAVLWLYWQYPGRPLFVKVINMRNVDIPLLTIEHGNDHTQEHILLTQLRAGEARIITLNHEPGKGYSVEAQLADGKTLEACVGKQSGSWVNRVVITPNGIFGG